MHTLKGTRGRCRVEQKSGSSDPGMDPGVPQQNPQRWTEGQVQHIITVTITTQRLRVALGFATFVTFAFALIGPTTLITLALPLPPTTLVSAPTTFILASTAFDNTIDVHRRNIAGIMKAFVALRSVLSTFDCSRVLVLRTWQAHPTLNCETFLASFYAFVAFQVIKYLPAANLSMIHIMIWRVGHCAVDFWVDPPVMFLSSLRIMRTGPTPIPSRGNGTRAWRMLNAILR